MLDLDGAAAGEALRVLEHEAPGVIGPGSTPMSPLTTTLEAACWPGATKATAGAARRARASLAILICCLRVRTGRRVEAAPGGVSRVGVALGARADGAHFAGGAGAARRGVAARRRRVAARRRAIAKVAAPDFGPHAPLVRARALLEPLLQRGEGRARVPSRAVAQARSGVCAGGIYLRVFVWLR